MFPTGKRLALTSLHIANFVDGHDSPFVGLAMRMVQCCPAVKHLDVRFAVDYAELPALALLTGLTSLVIANKVPQAAPGITQLTRLKRLVWHFLNDANLQQLTCLHMGAPLTKLSDSMHAAIKAATAGNWFTLSTSVSS